MSSTVVESSVVTGEHTAEHYAVGPRVRRKRPLRLRVHSVLRWLHIYTSMVSLIVVLFFAGTGVTLNHPDWLVGERTEEVTGTLPAAWKTANGIDWLVVSEHLRAKYGVRGTVADRTEDERQAALAFRAPGYSADAYVDVRKGSYRLTVSYQGAIGMVNDLHRGRDAGRAWAWLIDVAGVFLVLLSLTGLGLLFYLRKVRLSGLVTLAAGAALVIGLAWLAA